MDAEREAIEATNELNRLAVEMDAQSARRLKAIAELRSQGWTYEQIAQALGVTKARAQQLSNSALNTD